MFAFGQTGCFTIRSLSFVNYFSVNVCSPVNCLNGNACAIYIIVKFFVRSYNIIGVDMKINFYFAFISFSNLKFKNCNFAGCRIYRRIFAGERFSNITDINLNFTFCSIFVFDFHIFICKCTTFRAIAGISNHIRIEYHVYSSIQETFVSRHGKRNLKSFSGSNDGGFPLHRIRHVIFGCGNGKRKTQYYSQKEQKYFFCFHSRILRYWNQAPSLVNSAYLTSSARKE